MLSRFHNVLFREIFQSSFPKCIVHQPLYPTCLRAIGMGMSSMAAGFGLVMVPIILEQARLRNEV